MRVMFINPNSTASMTDKVVQSASNLGLSGVEILGRTNYEGPASIQGAADGEAAIPGLLTAVDAAAGDRVDVFVVACFDDTGLADIQKRCVTPVIGIGQAAFHASVLLGKTFSVVTTLSVSVPIIERNIEHGGLGKFCKSVRASEVPVLELEIPGSDAEERVSAEVELAKIEDGCEAIVLGCAGMTHLAERLQKKHGIPIIDGVVAATGLAVAIATVNRGPV